MKLVFDRDHLSITEFNPVELPDLTVLTGLNGSGKTHLFDAINTGAVRLEGLSHVVKFDTTNFFVEPEIDWNAASIRSDRNMLKTHLSTQGVAEKNFREHFIGQEYKTIEKIASKLNKSIYQLAENDFTEAGLSDLTFTHYRQYLVSIDSLISRLSHSEISSDELRRIVYKVGKKFDDITADDIMLHYFPSSYRSNLITARLGKIFVNYFELWQTNRQNAFFNNQYSTSHTVFTDSEFLLEYGPPPWETLQQILDQFSYLDYTINHPTKLEPQDTFRLKLISKKQPGLEIGFDSLSSGEKIMMALVSCLYGSKQEHPFPSLLLLDEIDNSLHPSMTKDLFKVIDEVLVKGKGVKVIMVTHSPSTVALAPKDSIYLMNKSSKDRIVKTTREDALSILTEGFVSLTERESSLQITFNLKKTQKPVVLTEGITDKLILDAAWEKLYVIERPFELQDCFDASFLRTLINRGELFEKYPSRKFFSVFDFDGEGFNSWNNLNNFSIVEDDPQKGLLKKHKGDNMFAMLLPVPVGDVSKQVIKSGKKTFENEAFLPIELLFSDVHSQKSRFHHEQKPGGGTLIKFTGSKVDFAENIVPTLPKDAFKNFVPLFESIKANLA